MYWCNTKMIDHIAMVIASNITADLYPIDTANISSRRLNPRGAPADTAQGCHNVRTLRSAIPVDSFQAHAMDK